MATTLASGIKALKGLVVMSPELEAVTNAIFDNRVPESWAAKSYPSLNPLSSWMSDLLERTRFISDWIEKGIPPVYWISGFFFPQAFLTGTLQNYARKMALHIDSVGFKFVVEDTLTRDTCAVGPDDGCYIRGLYFEGARWSYEEHTITESRPKELFTDMPFIWLKPEEQSGAASSEGIYTCPVYPHPRRNPVDHRAFDEFRHLHGHNVRQAVVPLDQPGRRALLRARLLSATSGLPCIIVNLYLYCVSKNTSHF